MEPGAARLFHNELEKLGVRSEFPFDTGDGIDPLRVVFLPDFGSPKGMVAFFGSLDHPEGGSLMRAAGAAGLYSSLVNDDHTHTAQGVKDALDDWVYFGPAELRPAWYTGKPWC